MAYSMDITQLGQAGSANSDYVSWRDANSTKDKSTLDFNDMLLLMVTQFQNQTIDNQADTADMMNQLIQMTVMQAITKVSTQVEEMTTANVMSYAASLVGQTVTLGVYDQYGVVQELVGEVEGTGTYNGMPVIFVNGQSYFLSSIMAVGKLPKMDSGDDDTVVTGESVTELTDGTVITVRENKDADGNVISREVTIDVPASEDKDASQTVIRTNGTVSVNGTTGNVTCRATGEDGYVTVVAGEDSKTYNSSVVTVNSTGEVVEATTKTTLADNTTITVREYIDSDSNAAMREVTIKAPASEGRDAVETVIRTTGTVSVDKVNGKVTCDVTGGCYAIVQINGRLYGRYEDDVITVSPDGKVTQDSEV